jgi:hypothetical protein
MSDNPPDSPPCIFCGSPTHFVTWRPAYSVLCYIKCESYGCGARGPTVRGEWRTQAKRIAVKAYVPLTRTEEAECE